MDFARETLVDQARLRPSSEHERLRFTSEGGLARVPPAARLRNQLRDSRDRRNDALPKAT